MKIRLWMRIVGYPCIPRGLLSKSPVDVLIVERAHLHRPTGNNFDDHVRDEIEATEDGSRPLLVIESWSGGVTTWAHGPTSKSQVARWEKAGYSTRAQFLKATSLGGAIDQRRTFVVQTKVSKNLKWEWPAVDPTTTRPRPMSNLLTPAGFIGKKSFLPAEKHAARLHIPTQEDPMPDQCGALIQTDRGVRRLMPDELGRGLGLHKPSASLATAKVLNRSTSVFIWEYIGGIFLQTGAPRNCGRTVTVPTRKHVFEGLEQGLGGPIVSDFQWKPPDLSVGSKFYQDRIATLREAVKTCKDPAAAYEEGLKILEVHRNNYNAEGPNLQEVQLIWWEYPAEHWEAIREGSRMNFLREPPVGIVPNAPMDEEQRKVATEFVEELRQLKIIGPMKKEGPILSNAPMFTVPKEGQPGQWRMIANMLQGGQNECIGPSRSCYSSSFGLYPRQNV